MRRSTKTLIITAALLVLIGVLSFVGIMAANHWDLTALSNAEYKTDNVMISEDFQDISVRSDTADIQFMPSDDGTCRVVFRTQKKMKCSASVRDGTLSIEIADTRKWYEQISIFSFESSKITVCLPQDSYGTLSVEESTGDIDLPEDFMFDSIEITASTGDIDCYAASSGSISIKTDTGSINVEGLTAGELELSVSTGTVDVRSVVCSGDVGVTVSTGRTKLTDVSCRNISSTGSTGDITLENVIASEMISIERSTGDVRFEKCDAGELLVKTDTGDVSGSLLSDKVFITQSDTGRVDVPETTTGGKCKITTDTGDIIISIS